MHESIRTSTIRDAKTAKAAPTVYGAPSTPSSAIGYAPAAEVFGAKRSVRNLSGK